MITQEEVKKILSIKGQVRGVTFKTDAQYVLSKEGELGLQKLKLAIKKTGVDIDYEKIKNIDWYPLGWRILSLLIIKDCFTWGDKELYNMGHSAPSNSFIVKILLRYFISFEKTSREACKYWGKHYTIGKLETPKFDEEKKEVIYQLKDFKINPVMCPYLMGYFMAIAELTNKSKDIAIKENQCSFKGDLYHEFIINW